MTEFIVNCVTGGTYSAVFAVMLMLVVKSGKRREQMYQSYLTALTDALKCIDVIDKKIDGITQLAERTLKAATRQKPPKSNTILNADAPSGISNATAGGSAI